MKARVFMMKPVAMATGPAAPARPTSPAPGDAARGSRRRRLWELPLHAHCPVIGVCLPIADVRQLLERLSQGRVAASDYELHSSVNTESRTRGPVAETLQKALDRRYAAALRATRALKDAGSLAAYWFGAIQGDDVAGALWAVLTHPACDLMLEDQVLQDVHMLQHQAGSANRADLRRLHALLDENAVLTRELAAAQQRSTRVGQEQAARNEQLHADLLRTRAELIARDTRIAALSEELRALEDAVPALRLRRDLSTQVQQQIERIQTLERALLRSREQCEQQRMQAADLRHALARASTVRAPDNGADAVADAALFAAEQAILCVGGRSASVPLYRRLVEDAGGRFLHHDGGEEDNPTRLDATLAAADLVICQTGCISHDAYWRVKDHCKRTGKRCVFVDKPSASSLRRALRLQVEAAAAADTDTDTDADTEAGA